MATKKMFQKFDEVNVESSLTDCITGGDHEYHFEYVSTSVDHSHTLLVPTSGVGVAYIVYDGCKEMKIPQELEGYVSHLLEVTYSGKFADTIYVSDDVLITAINNIFDALNNR